MLKLKLKFLAFCCFAICGSAAIAQESVYLSLADDNSFVVSARGAELFGLNFVSDSGGLSTVPTDGDPAAFTPSPFSILLSNSPKNVVYGTAPGAFLTLDGSLKLAAGWRPDADSQDLVFEWGGPATGARPREGIMADDFYAGGLPNELPSAFVDENQNLVFNNLDEAITSFTFSTQSGLLAGLELPDHWTVLERSDTEVIFTSPTGIAPADFGLVTWGGASQGNVFVSFTLEGGGSFGPFPLAGTENLPEPDGLSLLLVSFVGLFSLRRRRRFLRVAVPCASSSNVGDSDDH